MKFLAILAALLLSTALLAFIFSGCVDNACIRQSDCPFGQQCNAAQLCEDIPVVTDDGGEDGSTDLLPDGGRCGTDVECEVFTQTTDRAARCEAGLSQAQQEVLWTQLGCGMSACPIECKRHDFDVQIANPDQCWQCVRNVQGCCP